MSKARVATVWLEACSGCHMSFLDMDEGLIGLADLIELVYSPLVDAKEFPEDVDLTLVSGGVGNEEELELLLEIRPRTDVLVSFGDCAVTGNVPALRNHMPVEDVLERTFVQEADVNPGVPDQVVSRLRPKVQPLHNFVEVDEYIVGCPPDAELIKFIVSEILQGRIPGLGVRSRFG
ncbi:MAG: NADP oxidoreductase [Candidatus Brocadiia bacterium]